MNIAITGHRGLIGRHLQKRLEGEGNRIVLSIDKKEGKCLDDLASTVISERIDMLVHAAALCKINEAVSHPELAFKNDVKGTFEVLEFCRRNDVKKIVYFSSSRVLSKEKNPYTASKLYGEELCRGYKDSYGIDFLIIRPSTVYAPIWDETKRLMHMFIVNALEGKDLEIRGNPQTKTLDFTYIEDLIDGVMLAMSGRWNEDYNISGGEEYNIHRLAEMIIRKTGSKSRIVVKDGEIAQPQEVRLDIEKIKSRGYSPKVRLEEGIGRTIEFYKRHLGK